MSSLFFFDNVPQYLLFWTIKSFYTMLKFEAVIVILAGLNCLASVAEINIDAR